MDIDEVLALPRVSWADRKQLPNQPGLYFAITNGERIVYVGKAGRSLLRRWKEHDQIHRIRHFGSVEIAYVLIEDADVLKAAEWSAIQAFRPPLNRNYVIDGYRNRQQTWPFALIEPTP